MKKIILVLLLIVLLAGCRGKEIVNNGPMYKPATVAEVQEQNGYSNKEPFSEAEAISMVIKEYTDFPTNPTNIITKKLPIGGPQGATSNVELTTKVEKAEGSTYIVVLTKDWGITVNGKYVKSFWKYKVAPNSVSLLESVDNDYLPNVIK